MMDLKIEWQLGGEFETWQRRKWRGKIGEWKSQKYGSAVKSGDDRQRYGMENSEYWQRWKPNFMSLNKCNKLKVNSGGRRNIWKYGNTGKTGFTGIERE